MEYSATLCEANGVRVSGRQEWVTSRRELTLVQGVRSCYLGYRLLRVIVTCGAIRRFLVGFFGQSLLLCPNARSETDKSLPSTLDFTRRL